MNKITLLKSILVLLLVCSLSACSSKSSHQDIHKSGTCSKSTCAHSADGEQASCADKKMYSGCDKGDCKSCDKHK